jgi:hypothetical protein
MQALKVQRDAHDFVGASFHKWRNLDVVSPRELLADAAREIEPERSLPLGDVLKEVDDAEAIDEVSVDHRAVDCKVAREGTEGPSFAPSAMAFRSVPPLSRQAV